MGKDSPKNLLPLNPAMRDSGVLFPISYKTILGNSADLPLTTFRGGSNIPRV